MNVTVWMYDSVWGIVPATLEALCLIAERESDLLAKYSEEALTGLFHKNALSVRKGSTIYGTRYAYERNGIGIVPILGPIFPRANMMTEMSGATSAEMVAKDISILLNNPSIKSILMDIDSPGGAITGISELAKFINESQSIKPIDAFISGTGASAAYWLASAARRITMADTAEAGSIGVVMIGQDTSKRDERNGVRPIEIVSSQSPLKRVPISSDEGRAKIQRMVDSTADVFIAAVASNRAVSIDKVLSDFGQGDMFIAAEAVKRGMADAVSTFENEVQSDESFTYTIRKERQMNLSQKQIDATAAATAAAASAIATTPTTAAQATVTYTVEGIKDASPETYAAIHALGVKEGADLERKRILDIDALALAGTEKLISEARANPEMTAEKVAISIIKATQQKTNQATAAVTTEARALAGSVAQVAAATTATAGTEDANAQVVADRKAAAEMIAKGGSVRREAQTRTQR
jgi:signal peptide peptidase SppA